MKYRLSLNMGSHFVSYAIVDLDENNEAVFLRKTGIHYFDDGREPKTKESLAKTRRMARTQRKIKDRKLQRKHSLVYKFIKYGLIPESEKTTHQMKKLGQPLFYRHKAIYEPLTKLELAWALFNLNQKRGFTNTKIVSEKDEDQGRINTAYANMLDDMKESPTVGVYLYKRFLQHLPIKCSLDDNIYPSRQLMEKEFDIIRDIQAKYHPEITSQMWEDIRHTIFYQRPLREPECGPCLLFKEEKRAYQGLPSYKRIKAIEILSTLKIKEGNKNVNASFEVKQQVYEILQKVPKLTKKEIEEILNLKINLGRKKEIPGDAISHSLATEEYFGDKWFSYALELKDDIVHTLITKDPSTIYTIATKEWDLPKENAKKLSEFPLSLSNTVTQVYSRKALYLLLNKMEQNFINVSKARIEIGFPEITYKGEFDTLEYYGKVLPHIVSTFKHTQKDKSEENIYGIVNNPTLHIVFNRSRKIVNEIILKYGKPHQIIGKLESDLKYSYKVLEERRKSSEMTLKGILDIKNILSKIFHIENPNRSHILMYRLWVELNPKEPDFRFCPFSGEKITKDNLFSNFSAVYIIPFEKCYDTSIHNQILISNNIKERLAGKTPFEAFGLYSDNLYDNILKGIKKLPKEKQKLFEKNALSIIKTKVTQQFVDASYLSRCVKEYLSTICEDSWLTNSRLLSILRKAWDCQNICMSINPAITKNKEDLRYPLIDTIIAGVVNSDLSILTKFTINKQIAENVIEVPAPYKDFKDIVVDKLTKNIVSHRVKHKKAGALLQDQVYGKIDPKKHDGYNLCIRKSIFEVDPDKILDKRIKDRLISHLSHIPTDENEMRQRLKTILDRKLVTIKDQKIKDSLTKYIIDIPEKKQTELKTRLAKEELLIFSEMTGIKAVKTLVKKSTPITVKHTDGTGQEHIKMLLSAENYSVSVWAIEKHIKLRNFANYVIYDLKDFKNNFIVTFKTLISSQTVDDRPHPSAKLLLKLRKNDMILCNDKNDNRIVARVVTLDPNGKRIYVSSHHMEEKVLVTFRQLITTSVEKIAVTPLGEVKKGENLFEKYKK